MCAPPKKCSGCGWNKRTAALVSFPFFNKAIFSRSSLLLSPLSYSVRRLFLIPSSKSILKLSSSRSSRLTFGSTTASHVEVLFLKMNSIRLFPSTS